MTKNKFNQCLCEYCTNIELKLRPLNKFLEIKRRSDYKITDRYAASRNSLCGKPEGSHYYNRECLDRKCDHCGTKLIQDHFSQIINDFGVSALNWYKWESETYVRQVGNQEKSGSRKVLKQKKESVSDLIGELLQELESIPKHLFNAKCQYDQFVKVSENPPNNWVIMCMDFAENFTASFQDEIQSAHWNHNQITLHPIVCYYNCPVCGKNMHESLVFISDDLKHDSHLVHHFVSISNTYLQNERHLKIDREIHVSDGASSQYKSKIPFADVSYSMEDFGFPVEKHYFGSRHGKGPSDGETGVVKTSASIAVKNRKAVIMSSESMYEYCAGNLTRPAVENPDVCCHQRRKFFLVPKQDVNHIRPERIPATVPGTRSFHSVRYISSSFIFTHLVLTH